MRLLKGLIPFMIYYSDGIGQKAVAEIKVNFCLLNHEKIQPPAYPLIHTQQPVFVDFNQIGFPNMCYFTKNANKLFIHRKNGGATSVCVNTFAPVNYNLNHDNGNAVKYPDNKVSVFNRWSALSYGMTGNDNSDSQCLNQNLKEIEGTCFYALVCGNGEPPLKKWPELKGI